MNPILHTCKHQLGESDEARKTNARSRPRVRLAALTRDDEETLRRTIDCMAAQTAK